jgi:glycosyltransferase involved in cell wall biosynthesis
MTTLISIVSPVYKAEEIVDKLVERVSAEVSKITEHFEMILVEDGSPDSSWQKIVENCRRDKRVKGIKLSRNFGQHYAITAGLDHAKGDWVVVMDCDLQDRPEEIAKLYAKAQEGYDIVFARRRYRQDNFLKRFLSRLFYKVLSYLTDTAQDSAIANFGIYSKNVVQVLRGMREHIRYFPALVRWIGFKTGCVDVVHARREMGETSYSFRKGLNLALDVMLAFSEKPLRLAVRVGILISLTSFLYALYIVVRALWGTTSVIGWPSLIVSIWFLAGIIIFILGVVGLYVGKVFEQVKNRPLYVIEEISE